MSFLELVLFQERLNLIADSFDAINISNLVVPFVEFGQMRRKGSVIHGHDLLNLAEDKDVDHGELRPGQILVFLQLLVELDNDLLLKLVKQDSEFFLDSGVILIWKGSRLEHSLDQTPDQLARVAANLAIEIARDGCDGLVLVFIFVGEDAFSLLTSAHKPLEKSVTRS